MIFVDIPTEATMYVKKHYKEALMVVDEYIDCYGIASEQLIEAELGNP